MFDPRVRRYQLKLVIYRYLKEHSYNFLVPISHFLSMSLEKYSLRYAHTHSSSHLKDNKSSQKKYTVIAELRETKVKSIMFRGYEGSRAKRRELNVSIISSLKSFNCFLWQNNSFQRIKVKKKWTYNPFKSETTGISSHFLKIQKLYQKEEISGSIR